jgi:hypothetical protein
MAAVAIFDKESSQINIQAHLVFYGKYAENLLGQRIVDEINRMWNEPKASLEFPYQKFDITFSIDFECLSQDEVLQKVFGNTDFRNNFIRIEDKNIAERSMMGFGLGNNSGHWLITDQLGDSTTAAHEFGHAMGLPHPDQLDYRNTGMPPIMAPRGTIVDSEYQWNPLADAGAFGGTMRPIFRRVRAGEVLDILKGINPEKMEPLNIGNMTNMLFDEIGNPVGIQRVV